MDNLKIQQKKERQKEYYQKNKVKLITYSKKYYRQTVLLKGLNMLG
jgi:hypothetical protein